VQDHFGVGILAAGEPHRWLLGQQSGVISDQPFLVNDTKNLWLIGDWLCQGDGEGALVSATLAAQEFLASLEQEEE
jgi:predicted NAD/FAD-dependent oxidoreductase